MAGESISAHANLEGVETSWQAWLLAPVSSSGLRNTSRLSVAWAIGSGSTNAGKIPPEDW